jgi:hypothetical protein
MMSSCDQLTTGFAKPASIKMKLSWTLIDDAQQSAMSLPQR